MPYKFDIADYSSIKNLKLKEQIDKYSILIYDSEEK